MYFQFFYSSNCKQNNYPLLDNFLIIFANSSIPIGISKQRKRRHKDLYMITDVLENAGLYEGLNEKFKKAFNYLRKTDFSTIEKGKYEIDGDQIFAIVNEFETKDKSECELEAHKKHVDIQFVYKGVEMFGYIPFTGQIPVIDYDETRDVAFYKDAVSYIKLEAGSFIVFFPTDLHQPEVREFEPVTVKKVVIKIKI